MIVDSPALSSGSPASPRSYTFHVRDLETLTQQFAALRGYAQDCEEQLADMAERMAETFAELACVYDRLAMVTRNPATAARALRHAHRLRTVADAKRREYQRYALSVRATAIVPDA